MLVPGIKSGIEAAPRIADHAAIAERVRNIAARIDHVALHTLRVDHDRVRDPVAPDSLGGAVIVWRHHGVGARLVQKRTRPGGREAFDARLLGATGKHPGDRHKAEHYMATPYKAEQKRAHRPHLRGWALPLFTISPLFASAQVEGGGRQTNRAGNSPARFAFRLRPAPPAAAAPA